MSLESKIFCHQLGHLIPFSIYMYVYSFPFNILSIFTLNFIHNITYLKLRKLQKKYIEMCCGTKWILFSLKAIKTVDLWFSHFRESLKKILVPFAMEFVHLTLHSSRRTIWEKTILLLWLDVVQQSFIYLFVYLFCTIFLFPFQFSSCNNI